MWHTNLQTPDERIVNWHKLGVIVMECLEKGATPLETVEALKECDNGYLIRCKDCNWHEDGWCNFQVMDVQEDDFCSHGC